MTTRFYAPPDAFHGGRLILPEDEARHAIRALRHGVGDEIEVVDGAGGWYRVRLTEVGKRETAGEVVETRREVGEASYQLTIGLGVLKQAARFETFAEKAVELGVTAIIPLETERTERERVKQNRLENVLVAAMKQSGRSRLPTLHAPRPLTEVLATASGTRFLCHEAADPEAALLYRLAAAPPGDATVLVGPEGGFSADEVAEAEALGWQAVSLGPRRLRAETAAITAAAAVMLSRSA